jgi:hypothetical protein
VLSDVPFIAFGMAQNDTTLGGYAVLPQDIHTVDMHIGMSISSMSAPEKLDRVHIQGGSPPLYSSRSSTHRNKTMMISTRDKMTRLMGASHILATRSW